jgi:hypothetical protein
VSEERMEILRMVADKVIDVEDAERLLRALEEGDRRRSETRRPGVVAGALDGVSEAIGAIGQLVQSTVNEAMEGVDLEIHTLESDEDVLEIHAPEFEIPEGGRLSLRGRLSGGSLTLLPAEGDRCLIEAAADAQLRIRQKGNRIRVHWGQGPLTVRVPAAAAQVDAKMMGGDLVACGLACAFEAHAMGGRMELLGLQKGFDCKTMGGDLVLKLSPALLVSSRARTMGGNVLVEVPEALNARLCAVTMGGEVRVEPGIGKIRREGNRIQYKTVIGLGLDTAQSPEIFVKTTGGDVSVRREQH